MTPCDATQIELPNNLQYVSSISRRHIDNLGDKNLDLEISQFRANSNPYFLFVDENGSFPYSGYGYNTDATQFLDKLEIVRSSYVKRHLMSSN